MVHERSQIIPFVPSLSRDIAWFDRLTTNGIDRLTTNGIKGRATYRIGWVTINGIDNTPFVPSLSRDIAWFDKLTTNGIGKLTTHQIGRLTTN